MASITCSNSFSQLRIHAQNSGTAEHKYGVSNLFILAPCKEQCRVFRVECSSIDGDVMLQLQSTHILHGIMPRRLSVSILTVGIAHVHQPTSATRSQSHATDSRHCTRASSTLHQPHTHSHTLRTVVIAHVRHQPTSATHSQSHATDSCHCTRASSSYISHTLTVTHYRQLSLHTCVIGLHQPHTHSHTLLTVVIAHVHHRPTSATHSQSHATDSCHCTRASSAYISHTLTVTRD